MAKIYLDAGHGGSDSGACNGSRTEKADVLRMALAVGEKLQAQGVQVLYSRSHRLESFLEGLMPPLPMSHQLLLAAMASIRFLPPRQPVAWTISEMMMESAIIYQMILIKEIMGI